MRPHPPDLAPQPPDGAPPLPDDLALWLAAEDAGAEADADAALTQLLGALDRVQPPGGFADRVMAAIASDAPASSTIAVPRPVLPGAWRHTLAARLGLAAGGLLAAVLAVAAAAAARTAPRWLPPVLRHVAGADSIAALLQALIGAIGDLSQWIAGLVSLGSALALIVRAVVEPLATPVTAGAIVACLLLAVIALRYLHDAIQRDRRWVYADPI